MKVGRFTVAMSGLAAFCLVALVLYSMMLNGPPRWSAPEAPAQAKASTVDRITDPLTLQAFSELIIKQGSTARASYL
jgi:hypothetical protein